MTNKNRRRKAISPIYSTRYMPGRQTLPLRMKPQIRSISRASAISFCALIGPVSHCSITTLIGLPVFLRHWLVSAVRIYVWPVLSKEPEIARKHRPEKPDFYVALPRLVLII